MSLSSGTLTRFSDTFVISCGTITLDPAQARMLLIRWKKNGEVFLPKGRKNIGETLEDAAVRETYEETGVRVTLLRLQIPTLATPGAAATPKCGFTTEPVAFSQRTTGDGTLKLIFWFSAQGDSTTAHDTGTQEEGEDFEPVWVGLDEAVQTLTFGDDKDIAKRVIQLYNIPFYYGKPSSFALFMLT
ncbi:NUDIX hydrolase domain-like protein [Geopyxis carbonaria]|nr:NUDIX hydrolase domain-like protein [Geopyxis carbonaria]